MQVPCSDLAEVSEEGIVWQASKWDREDPTGAVPTERGEDGGGECRWRPYSYGVEYSPEVQRGDDDGVSEGEERCANTPGIDEDEGYAVRPEVLGSGILREYGWSERAADPSLRSGTGRIAEENGCTARP